MVISSRKLVSAGLNVIEELVTLEPLQLLPLVSKTKVPSCSSHMIVTWSAGCSEYLAYWDLMRKGHKGQGIYSDGLFCVKD